MVTRYSDYKLAAMEAGLPPLTRSEWSREGGLSLEQSVSRSHEYHEAKLMEELRQEECREIEFLSKTA